MDRTSVIFGNPIDAKTIRQAEKSKAKYIKKFGDDTKRDYHLSAQPIEALGQLGVQNLVLGDEPLKLGEKPLVVGNIRMGFGHYRIAIAMASCARALGYTPYWMDLASFDATGSAMIRAQNDLYSLGSRISQKSRLFNHFVWEPMNCEGFRALTYNAKDQKNSELLAPLYADLPADVPFIGTHVWTAQGAVHAGMTHVVNAIPDNWPMAMHLSEGAIHAVQTPFAWSGYKELYGFSKKPLSGMPASDLKLTGCYVDHELLVHLKEDNDARRQRMKDKAPLRILMTVGGAGAGFSMFLAMVEHLLPYVQAEQVALFINFGDHKDVYEQMIKKLPGLSCKTYFNEYGSFGKAVRTFADGEVHGVHAICHENIFEAVYATNLLMPVCDLLVTKPSELVFYPMPKLFMRHIGGHEVYGAIHGREFGDATRECSSVKSVCRMLTRLIEDREIIANMCDRIDALQADGYYNGAYECVRLAAAGR